MEYKHPGGLVHKVQVEADDTDEGEKKKKEEDSRFPIIRTHPTVAMGEQSKRNYRVEMKNRCIDRIAASFIHTGDA
jgi:hypothetical protein